MDNKKLKELLLENEESSPVNPSEPTPEVASEVNSSNNIDSCILAVMESYQNANRYLDIIKEDILINKGLVFFSEYVHNLAHTMPVRFDAFGDILHTKNILVPYPPTSECPYHLEDCNSIFSAIFDILNKISSSLREFIKCTQDTENHSMACKVEELLLDIDSEFENLYRMKKIQEISEDNVKFDKWINQYIKFKEDR